MNDIKFIIGVIFGALSASCLLCTIIAVLWQLLMDKVQETNIKNDNPKKVFYENKNESKRTL